MPPVNKLINFAERMPPFHLAAWRIGFAWLWFHSFPVFSQVVNTPPVPEWIGSRATEQGKPLFFRIGLEVPEKMLKLILMGVAEGEAEVWVNTTRVGSVRNAEQLTSIDLTAATVAGRNVLGLKFVPDKPGGRIAALLELNGDLAHQRWVNTSSRWMLRDTPAIDWLNLETKSDGWQNAVSFGRADAASGTNLFDPKKMLDAYNSWRMALGAAEATDPNGFSVPKGFRVTRIRSAQPGEDSWVAMTFDSQGRIIVAKEKKGLLRFRLNNIAVESVELIHDTLQECRGLLQVGPHLYCNANNTKALVRLSDLDGDGKHESIQELLRTEGGVGHGRNHIKLGPDGWIYVVHGNNVKPWAGTHIDSPFQGYQEDQVISNPWDPSMFDGDVLVPAGHVLRFHPGDPSRVEMVAGGFRNPMDIAFNNHGDMFTFDADMEWDVGAAWYMPNRVIHVVPGADYGFRRGTGRFRTHHMDTLPSVADIGLASPTAVYFGYGSKFPQHYQDSLYICDWAYGRILAVRMEEVGATYRGKSEVFLSGRPLNVTDGCIGPDGAMWFITGGRGTLSGLYRVTYEASQLDVPIQKTLAQNDTSRQLRAQRKRLELGGTLDEIWKSLESEDRWIRYMGRVGLERMPAGSWDDRLLREENVRRTLELGMVSSRLKRWGSLTTLHEKLLSMDLSIQNAQELSDYARIWSVGIARDSSLVSNLRGKLLPKLEAVYPVKDFSANSDLCRLLAVLGSKRVIGLTLPLIRSAESSEELLEYPFLLRFVREGWSSEAWEVCFDALARAGKKSGAQNYFRSILACRADLERMMPDEERERLRSQANAPSLERPDSINSAVSNSVKEWTVDELGKELHLTKSGRSFFGGKNALVKAQCVTCHKVFADQAMTSLTVGPDLMQVGARFGGRDLLEHILLPSKVIDEKYIQTTLKLRDDTEVTGLIESAGAEELMIRPNPFTDEKRVIRSSWVVQRTKSAVSPMPEGLLGGLNKNEILDLIAYLESGGNASDARFR